MGSVIVAGARTPMGKLLGELKTQSGVDLGAVAIKGALERAGVSPDQVDYVIMGQVLQAGAGQMPARQAATKAGIPMSTPSLSINKVCLSGLNAIALADQLIRAGECDVVVAGGMESMTNAPHLLPKSREGIKYGDATLTDSMSYDGLWDAVTDQSMGALTEEVNKDAKPNFTREEMDAFGARSHQRAAAAKDKLAEEIVEVRIPQRRGDDVVVTADEGIRGDTTAEGLGKLRGAFVKDGLITAGTSSPISDGACAVVVMSKEKAEELGVEVLAEIGAHGMTAGPDSSLQLQPSHAIVNAAKKAGVDPAKFDLYEINEAFAAVGLACGRDLGMSDAEVDERFNVNGGAIALGHPIGMSGARLVYTLAKELQRRGGGTGVAALCGGGGQGDALIITVPSNGAKTE